MDALNTMSNARLLIIQNLDKQARQALQTEADTNRMIREAGLSRPGIFERAVNSLKRFQTVLGHNTQTKVVRLRQNVGR